jgi:Cu(I)/Ag(I) efflux system membrane protein CusA/SilA
MLGKVIASSAKNPFVVGLLTIVLIAWGGYAMFHTPVDAIPDLSDVQVIVFTEYPGQAPQVVEDQVTYPLSTAMLSVPRTKVVRGYSFFGLSFVYIIFEDSTDPYWARSRVLENLNFVSARLPDGITPSLGPDATGVGWIYEYALVDRTGHHDLAQLRSIQDWYLRYELQALPGVSEVASVGGFVQQYQIEVDPNILASFGISLAQVRNAITSNNADVGGKLIEFAESEFMIRGRGYLGGIEDLKQISVGTTSSGGIPILLRDIATIQRGPELRRGLTDLDGLGGAPAGIVVMRFGENALETIERVKQRLGELEAGLPEGVEIVTTYDRSGLIKRAIGTLSKKLLQEITIVSLICFLFLFHLRSALVAIVTLPLGILFSFVVMYHQGLNANIMSLGGIAIAIGVMVDAAIVMIENAHKHLERNQGVKPRRVVVTEAAREVGPSLFFSLLVVVVSFLPVFTLEAQAGRLFSPLAYTKTYAMLGAALLSITVVPLLMIWLISGNLRRESANPINRWMVAAYRPVIDAALNHKLVVLAAAALALALTWIPIQRLGSEFMPPLNEGDLLYMPSADPGVSITKMREVLQQTDRIISQFPEVKRVFGKAGRAETATDPAPLGMIETTIMLESEENWRPGMTMKKLIAELDQALQIPGLRNIWTMPIKTRIDMLATGIKTPVGIKIAGSDLEELGRIGERIETIVGGLPGTRSAISDRVTGGNYLDFDIDRGKIARHGLSVNDVQDTIESAIGGMNVSWSIEGRERYPINVRYPKELRDNLANLRRVIVSAPNGAQIPLEQLVDIEFRKGPASIKTENARLNAWVLVDLEGIDVGSWVARAQEELAAKLTLPAGYAISWSGEFEYIERTNKRLAVAIPITLVIIFVLLFANFRNIANTLIVMVTVPLSLVGGFWLLDILDYEFSAAVGVGFIGLVGITTEIGVVLIVFMEEAVSRHKAEGRLQTREDLDAAVREGALLRLRPIAMTVMSTMAGLLPILWASGTGAEAMSRIAAPMVGGLASASVLALVVIPVVFALVRSRGLPYRGEK